MPDVCKFQCMRQDQTFFYIEVTLHLPPYVEQEFLASSQAQAYYKDLILAVRLYEAWDFKEKYET